jgi:hypothetical protein
MNKKNGVNSNSKHLHDFAKEFSEETDRAAVVLGAAKLDLLLYQVLSRALLPCSTSKDELLEGEGSLSTFNSRILTVHRLGLITDDLARAIHLVRKIRNDFAHQSSGVSLEVGAHRDRIRELDLYAKTSSQYNEAFEIFSSCKPNSKRFRTAVLLISVALDVLVEKLQPFPRSTGADIDGRKTRIITYKST